MTSTGRMLPALALAAAFAVAGSALAAEPEVVATAAATGAPPSAPEVVPTAAGTGAPPSVADQIDSYLKTSPAAKLPNDGAAGVTPGSEPRKVHGMVDVSVGTGGYRSAYVQTEVPIGKNATATFAFGETQFGNRFAGRYGGQFAPGVRQSFGLGLRFDDAALDPSSLRCRQAAGEDGLGVRRDPRLDGDRLGSCPGAGMPSYPQ
nr:hypothetical protein [Phenylobacterium sp.]